MAKQKAEPKAKHECQIPSGTTQNWTCRCGQTWIYKDEPVSWLTTAWHGRDSVRNGDGSKLGFWQ